MKKILFAALLTGTVILTGLTASANDRDRDEHPRTIGAQEMSAAGLLAASAVGTGIYWIRRRSKSRT